jgi:aspartate carbamoyltransferase catalytic subunit
MSKHLIDAIDFTNDEILQMFKETDKFLEKSYKKTLSDKLVISMFFENSTRTISSFEVALKRLGASFVNLDVSKSSTSKGETMSDTAANLDAMGPDAIIVRHQDAGAPDKLSKYVNSPIVNAGDGSHAHPTQALLDLYTIKKYYKDLNGKKIAIMGDIKNSRVANSNIKLLTRFGMEVILVSPPYFRPETKLRCVTHISEVIDKLDVVMSLRIQRERHKKTLQDSVDDYADDYCITKDMIGNRDLIILHPGPVNRNVDISNEMLADSRCKVLEQVKNGVAIRMAVMQKMILGSKTN